MSNLPPNWTESRFNSFVISALRKASMKWPYKHIVLKNSRQKKGMYLCNICNEVVPVTVKQDNGTRKKNVYVDHIKPVVDPEVGFVSWDDFIKRLFVGEDGLQVICKKCHDEKSKKEKLIAKQRTKKGS